MSEERQRGNVLTVVGGLCAAVVLYVLSTGPVMRFYYPDNPPKAFLYFYAPLVWLFENTPLKRPIERYVEIWRPKSKPR